jgi:hypothetical protein
MAQLILNEEEKKVASWLDMPDETLGQRVRQMFVNMNNLLTERERFTIASFALHLACNAAKQNTATVTYEMKGVTFSEKGLGDWEVKVSKIS